MDESEWKHEGRRVQPREAILSSFFWNNSEDIEIYRRRKIAGEKEPEIEPLIV